MDGIAVADGSHARNMIVWHPGAGVCLLQERWGVLSYDTMAYSSQHSALNVWTVRHDKSDDPRFQNDSTDSTRATALC